MLTLEQRQAIEKIQQEYRQHWATLSVWWNMTTEERIAFNQRCEAIANEYTQQYIAITKEHAT